LVFPILTLRPFCSIPSFHCLIISSNFLWILSTVPDRQFHGKPVLNYLESAPSMITNSNSDNTDPWWTPTFTANSLSPAPSLTEFNDLHTLIELLALDYSSTPDCLNSHHNTSWGTRSNAFTRSTNAIHTSFFCSRNFSWICSTMIMAFVVPLPGLNKKTAKCTCN
jgi:hypothetical protein